MAESLLTPTENGIEAIDNKATTTTTITRREETDNKPNQTLTNTAKITEMTRGPDKGGKGAEGKKIAAHFPGANERRKMEEGKQEKVEIEHGTMNVRFPNSQNGEGKQEKGARERQKGRKYENAKEINPFSIHSQTQEEEDDDSLNPFLARSHSHSHREGQGSMEEALTCSVCLREFDSEYRRPILLPSCGHTFCRICVKGLSLRSPSLLCPTCRHEYRDVEVDDFPINFSLQLLTSGGRSLREAKPPDVNECSVHGVRLAFWCRTCEVTACGECLYESHPQDTHDLSKMKEALVEVRSKADQLLKEAKKEAKEQLAGSLRRVQESVWNLQEASHILQEAQRISRSVEESYTLSSIASSFKGVKEMKRRLREMSCGDGGDGADGASSLPSPPPLPSSSPSSSLGTAGAWGSGCALAVAQSEKGGIGKIQAEEMGVHLYSLHPPTSTSFCVAMKLQVLLENVNKASPWVFLDLRAGQRPLGRVYIQLNGEMRRAKQFIALCLGTFGPCYRGTSFDGVSNRGQAGEYVRGGDYMGKKGMGGEAVMDNLEWGGIWSKPIKAGQVCGVGGEQKGKFGALFAICLSDNPSGTFHAPFGRVVSGMEVIEVACRHDPFDRVKVWDCGVVLEV